MYLKFPARIRGLWRCFIIEFCTSPPYWNGLHKESGREGRSLKHRFEDWWLRLRFCRSCFSFKFLIKTFHLVWTFFFQEYEERPIFQAWRESLPDLSSSDRSPVMSTLIGSILEHVEFGMSLLGQFWFSVWLDFLWLELECWNRGFF